MRDLDLDAAGNYSASAGYAYIYPCYGQGKPVLDVTRVFIDGLFIYLPIRLINLNETPSISQECCGFSLQES